MTNHLLLQIHFTPGNEGCLVLKRAGMTARIKNLCNALPFVANMKQLSLAIDTGAKQDCSYELQNNMGLQWIMACRFSKGIVGLELWFQKLGFNEQLDTLFDWQGSVEEFRKAIAKLIERLPRYRFIWF